MITVVDLAHGLEFSYLRLYRWCARGIIRAEYRDAGGKGFYTVGHDAAIEAAVIVRLRCGGVPLQRIRRAVEVLRREGVTGARWLALNSFGPDVLIRDKGALLRVADRQGFLSLLDLADVRGEVLAIERKAERKARGATA